MKPQPLKLESYPSESVPGRAQSAKAAASRSGRSADIPAKSQMEADRQQFLDGANRFVAWLERSGYASYDPYDIWGTSYGLLARRLYYRKNLFGHALVAPILLLEILCPGWRKLFVRRMRYATADAQLILGFMNLARLKARSESTSETESPGDPASAGRTSRVEDLDAGFLNKAIALGEEVLAYSIPGYQGHCWGYPFDWENNRGLWRKNTPYITCTPYCFEAYLALHDATGEDRYLQITDSIARFVSRDLKDTKTGADAAAGSYSPIDETKVVNASAYRAYVLFEAAARFKRSDYERQAWQNLNFILQSQREDGSWLYAVEDPAESFIDHFHTCFVLKNVWKLNQLLQDGAVKRSIEKGYQYYRRGLFDAQGNPKSFAIEPRLQIARLEMYNFAEAITLGALLKHDLPEAFSLSCDLARNLVGQYQLADGHFVTRVYLGGLKHRFPFLRWPQAQLFYALTNLLSALTAEGGA